MDKVEALTQILGAFNLGAPIVLQIIGMIRSSGSVTDDETLAALDAEYDRRLIQADQAAK